MPTVADLESRHAALLARSNSEREAATLAFGRIVASTSGFDAGLMKMHRWLGDPALFGAGAALVWLVARRRGGRRVSGLLGLASAAIRIRSLIKAAVTQPAGRRE